MSGREQGVDVSLIVCTRNRLASLERTVESIGRARIPPGMTAELLVVDNGSTDGTVDWLRGRPADGFPMRVAEESRPGLSRARNRALGLARGRVLLWTDDDVVVEPDWLQRMTEPILAGRADAVVGNIVIPERLRALALGTPFETRMEWMTAHDWTDRPAPESLIGANMAFAARVLRDVPDFDERLGAGPDSLGYYEESLFSWRLLEAGYRLGAVPDAVVHHHFDESRLDPDRAPLIAESIGRSLAYVDWHWRHRPPRRYLGLRRLWARVRHRARFPGGGADARERRFLDAWSAGWFDEFRRCMEEPRKYARRTRPPGGANPRRS